MSRTDVRFVLIVAAVLVTGSLASGSPTSAAAGVPGTIATIAGGGVGDGGPALAAALTRGQTVVDGAGDLYVADSAVGRVRKVSGGTITTFAGGGPCCSFATNGPATDAHLFGPAGLAFDQNGDLYIADPFPSCRVLKVSAGTISLAVGNGTCAYAGDGGPPTSATLRSPTDLAVDGSGNLYILDDCRVRKVSAGTISTIAGDGGCALSPDGGPATAASLAFPVSVALDLAGNVYIVESNGCGVRKVSGGTISTVAGNGTCGFGGDGIPATSASLRPSDVTSDGDGNLYIAESAYCRIRKVSAGTITTVVGTGFCGYTGDGGAAASANIDQPGGLSLDAGGNLYLDDGKNCVVRKVSGGTIATIAGSGSCTYGGDGDPATSARLYRPNGIAFDSAGNLYIADSENCRVREVSGGIISTIAGTGVCAYGGDGGPATSSRLNSPQGIGLDGDGNLYIADDLNCRVRKVSGGSISTVVGNGACTSGGDGGPATTASLYYPSAIALDSAGNLYVGETLGCRVRRVSGGTVTTVAGNGICNYAGDGGSATSASLQPLGLVVDAAGDLYISGNCRVRKVSAGIITTVAGNGSCSTITGDGGPASSAGLNFPQGLALDGGGNLFIADRYNCRVRRVSDGTITTVAGSGSCNSVLGDGGPAQDASLWEPQGVTLDPSGNLYIADSVNSLIRKVERGGEFARSTVLASDGAIVQTGSVATSADPTITQISVPPAAASMDFTLTIAESAGGTPPSGFIQLGQQVQVTTTPSGISFSPPATIRFVLDVSVTLGITPSAVQIFRDGVPVPNCGSAPCVSGRGILTGGDIFVDIRTTGFSLWRALAADADGDRVPDDTDNCPFDNNPTQTNTDGNNKALNRPGQDRLGDACDDNIAGDGYTNAQHVGLGKDPAVYCKIMRADVDGDGAVSILDLAKVGKFFGQTFTLNPTVGLDTGIQRLNQDGDNAISILDLARMAQVFIQPVTACP